MTLRRQPGVNGKFGVIGLGLGGLISFLAAVRGAPDAAVFCYGSGIECRIDEARTMTTPSMLHLAGEDEFMSSGAHERIRAVLDPMPQVVVEIYPRCRPELPETQTTASGIPISAGRNSWSARWRRFRNQAQSEKLYRSDSRDRISIECVRLGRNEYLRLGQSTTLTKPGGPWIQLGDRRH